MRPSRALFALSLPLLVAAPALAAKIEGTVRDRATGEAIAGARVTVVGPDRSTSVDRTGAFALDGVREGTWPVKVEAPGYLPVVVPGVPLDDRRVVAINAKLRKGIVQAPAAVVAADRPSRLAQTETSRRSFTAEEVTKIAGAHNDPILALTTSAGVNMGGFGQVVVRGGGANDNLYFIDNIQIGNPFHFGGLVSVFNANTISKVDLYAGALPARYGNAKSAVIDIETRQPKADALHGVLEGNLLYSEALLEGPLAPGWSAYLAGRRSYIDLFVGRFLPAFTVFPRFSDFQGKVSGELPGGGRLDLMGIGAQDAVSVVLPDGGVSRGVGTISEDTGYSTKGVVWRQPLGEGASNRITLDYQEPYTDLQIGRFLSIYSQRYWWTAADDAVFQLNDQHQLRAGLRYDTINFLERQTRPVIPPGIRRGDLKPQEIADLPTRSTDTLGNQKVYGAYVEDAYKVTEPITLSVGARFDELGSTLEDHVAPRLGVSWRADPETTWRLAYGQQFQFPSIDQMLPGIGNPSLIAPFSRDYVAGLDHQLTDWLFGRLELYHRDILLLTEQNPAANYDNLGSGRSDGAELTLEAKDWNGWSGNLAFTVSQTYRTTQAKGELISGDDQPLIANLTLSGPKLWDWSPSLRFRYSTGKPYTPVVDRKKLPDGTWSPVYGADFSRRYPDGILWSARAERPAGLFGLDGKFYFEVTQQHEALAIDYGDSYEKIDHPDYNFGIPAIPYFGYQLRF